MTTTNRFPELTKRQIEALMPFGVIQDIPKNTFLVNQGDFTFDFFVIIQGTIDIINPYDEKHIIVTHTANQFTGDSDMLSKRAASFNAITKVDSKVLRIISENLLEAISKYSNISDLLLSTFMLRQDVMREEFTGGIKLIGTQHSKRSYEIREFLEKNHIWHNWVDIDKQEDVKDFLRQMRISKDEIPIIIDNNDKTYKHPTIKEVARITGVVLDFDDTIYDVIVVGAGPAGLAASVYAASEGLSVITIDGNNPGGQAGKSSKIENYLGFPTGISGGELAHRAYIQAQKFGCHISIPHKAVKLKQIENNTYQIELADKASINAKSVIIATGAAYRNLPLNNLDFYIGQGVYYSATTMNAQSCRDEIVGVVGGGNSAGQAALFLADHAEIVYLIIRSAYIGAKMSDYLVQRILSCKNIMVNLQSEVIELIGEFYLESIRLKTSTSTMELPIANLFTFIGAKPCTNWLEDTLQLDDKGFILTGFNAKNRNTKMPQSLETSLPGVFAVGDVRKDSVKRVASAVGEGSMAVSQVHQHLAIVQKNLP